MKTLVISHKSCTDGFAAAWVHHRLRGDVDTNYHFASYGSAPPWELIDKDTLVYIFDFSYPRQLLIEVLAKCGMLVVLDHHKTAQVDLEGFQFAQFDMLRSGAGMAWDHLCAGTRPRPWLVDYVEDRDLWNHKLPYTKEVNAFLTTVPKDFDRWDCMADDPNSRADAISAGAMILEFIRQRNMDFVNQARMVDFCGYRVPFVNAPNFFASEVGALLAAEHPFAVVWSQDAQSIYRYSLRSTPDGVDVSEIAKLFGGGGHKHASGCSSDRLLA